jgi:hypothetical protein
MGGIDVSWRPPAFDEALVVSGEGQLAAVSLNLALDAAARYAEDIPDAGLPIATEQFESLRKRAKAARDAVAHWDDKLNRSPDTRLELNGIRGILVVAPGPSGTKVTVTAISWSEAKLAATSCLDWAER